MNICMLSDPWQSFLKSSVPYCSMYDDEPV